MSHRCASRHAPQPVNLPQPPVQFVPTREDAAHQISLRSTWFRPVRLLEQALAFHETHKTKDCPVCGTADVLSRSWATATRKEVAKLKTDAAACESAETESKAATREAQRFLLSPPPALAESTHLGLVSLAEARKRWIAWAEGREIESLPLLADHGEPATATLTKLAEYVWPSICTSVQPVGRSLRSGSGGRNRIGLPLA